VIKKKYFLSLSLILALIWTSSTAQKKYEREYHIRQSEVPKRAGDFVSSVFKNAKISWYGEESLTGRSVEAKLKNGGERYSIEFDEAGKIQDIEILSSFGKIETGIRKIIKENLEKSFSKYKVTKTQVQWSGTESKLKEALLAEELPKEIVTRYELVVKGTKDKKKGYFEILFEGDGSIAGVKEIVQRNADNLIY
jgi:uncharacterized protein YuzE